MKILFFASSSIHSIKWIKYFAKAGHEVHWLTFDAIDEEVKADLNVTIYEAKKKSGKILSALAAVKFSNAVIKSVQPDLIHVHYLGFYGFLAVCQNQVPFVCTAWGSDILVNKNNLLKRWVLRRILSRALLVTTDADHMLVELRSLGVPEEKLRRINFGIDTGLFAKNSDKQALREKYGLSNTSRVILSTRNHYEVYDIQTIIRAFLNVQDHIEDAKLFIAGRGPLTDQLVALVKSLSLSESVNFIGPYDVKTLKELLEVSDVYVSASLSDAGIAASTAEAMSMSLPVVISNVCENSAWVCSDTLLFEPGSPEDLSNKLVGLLANSSNLVEIGSQLRELVIKNNDYYLEMEKMNIEYNRVYGLIR